MQRVKRKDKKIISNNKSKGEYTIINLIPNGNNDNKNIAKTPYIDNEVISIRSNKFLSIPERQKIIHEINETKNQLKENEISKQNEILKLKQNEDNKNLYIKKTKSDMNLFDIQGVKANNFTRNKNNKNNIGIKFTENTNLVNKTIKEYYKKIDNPFKTYLKTLNIGYKENTKHNNFKNNQKTEKINPPNRNEYNRNKSNDIKKVNSNKNTIINEIYKKPISGKNFNKVNTNNDVLEKNNYNKFGNNNSNNNFNKLYIANSARKEKINCTKMINNNGIKKNIFNIINNYNTKTIRNKNKEEINFDINFNKKNNIKDFIPKNNSLTNIKSKKNNNINKNKNINNIITDLNSKYYLYQDNTELDDINNYIGMNFKNNSCKNNKNLKIIKSVYFEDDINNNIYEKVSTINDNKLINDLKKNIQNILYNNSNNQKNIKYTKKSIKSPGIGDLPKNRIFKGRIMSNDLSNVIIDRDLKFCSTPNEKNIFKVQKNGKENKINNNNRIYKNEENNFNDNNTKYLKEIEFLMNKENEDLLNDKINKFMNTDIKFNYKNKTRSSNLDKVPRKDFKKNKSFSYTNENEDNNNIYQNGKNNYKYQNGRIISPSNNSYKTKYNLNKSLITKEVTFHGGANKNSSYYNSDDDIMNSNNNSNVGSFNDITNVISGINNSNSFDNRINNNIFFNNFKFSYNNSNNNTFSLKQNVSPSSDYYFNYLSNKINNDILNEKKINKIEKNLYNN